MLGAGGVPERALAAAASRRAVVLCPLRTRVALFPARPAARGLSSQGPGHVVGTGAAPASETGRGKRPLGLTVALGLLGAGGIAGGIAAVTQSHFARDASTPPPPPSPPVPRPIVLCGPSGSGKSTLLKLLFQEYPDAFGFSISHTTRKPRPGEENGREYHFVPRAQMLEEIAAHKFIEHAEFSGNIYGTSYKSVQSVLDQGKNVILDIDMQGVKQLQASTFQFTTRPAYIFLAPPSVEELERRLRGRGTEDAESLAARLAAAKAELAWGYQPGSVDHLIINRDVSQAYGELKRAIFGPDATAAAPRK